MVGSSATLGPAMVILAISGCADPSSEATFLTISIDHSQVPGDLHVSSYFGGGTTGSKPIATPEILAGHVQLAEHAMSWAGRPIVEFARNAFGVGAGSLHFDHPTYVGVAAIDSAGKIIGGWSGPIEKPENATISITLDPALQPEQWGTQREGGSCYRLDTGSITVYLTDADDPDCDGLTGAQDNQPYAFCDPAATSGPAHDACR